MGQKVHPYGFRLGYNKNWQSRWFSKKEYASFVFEDHNIRKYVKKLLYSAGVARIEIERFGGRIRLIRLAQDGRRGERILVQDDGKGIPPEEMEKITQPFYMVDKSRSRKEGGAGLGLALCSRIAALHSLRLSIESRLGEGTTVTLEFPIDSVPENGDSPS